MSMKRNLLVIFDSSEFSGHEKMGLKITQALRQETTIITTSSNIKKSMPNDLKISQKSYRDIVLLSFRRNVLLISGSPYGSLLLKISIWMFGGRITEYTPFPELRSMQDRLHHRFVPTINRITVKKRILIEDWQVNVSSVKNIFIIRNLI